MHDVVNDGLMSLFFLLAGLEIRREMTCGRLATLRGAAAPGIAALGGMVVPALIYLAATRGDAAAARGWAVPVATDIAFSLAVLRVLGRRASPSLRVFLTALAILDDLGAILVIALFYTAGLSAPALAGAAALWLAMWGMTRARVRVLWPYLLGGAVLWLLVRASGVHATLAGVALAFVVPGRPARAGAASAADRLEHRLAPWVAYGVLPIFGLANAGLDLRGMHAAVLLSPGPLGVLLGLCLGKQAGVFGATLLGRRLGVLTLPPAMGVGELYGAAVLCGIGFTMSLFIGDLAFRATPLFGRHQTGGVLRLDTVGDGRCGDPDAGGTRAGLARASLSAEPIRIPMPSWRAACRGPGPGSCPVPTRAGWSRRVRAGRKVRCRRNAPDRDARSGRRRAS